MPTEPSRFAALDLLSTLAAVVNPQGQIVFANAALESTIGLSRRMLQGAAFAQFLATPSRLPCAPHTQASAGYAAISFDDSLLRHALPPLLVHITVSQVEHSSLQLIELWVLEQQARQEREERLVEQAQAHKELVRNLAHEIKNPLGGLRGAAQLLEMELPEPALKEYTQVIIREADRLHSLVDRLLLPHRQPHQLAPLNIHEICEHVASLLLLEHPRNLHIQRDYDASIPEFRGDREQLIQVLLNLMQNAAQALSARIACGDNATITLCTRIARQVTIGRQRHKLALALQVIDNGPGVPAHLQPKIFYPLVSGHDGGSGLGLSLAQTFVQRHHGLIECDSRPGHTSFRLLIPLT